MRRLVLALVLCLLHTSSAFADGRIQGWCEDGNYTVTIPGGATTVNRFQRSFPACTVTVYLAGTVTLASIFSDDAGTVQANPFTAANSGRWSFYADNGTYDVRLSGGGITSPFTLGNITAFDPNKPTGLVRDCAAPVFGTGADSTIRMDACIDDLPAAGGVADARGLTATTLSTTLTISKANVTLLLPSVLSATAGIVVSAQSVNIIGLGVSATDITFAPTGTASFITFSAGASVLYFGSVRDLYIHGTNAQFKTGIELTDTSNIYINNVRMALSGSTNNEGIRLEGREATYITNNYIEADQPLHIADNPNSTIDNDFTSLINNEFIGPQSGTPLATILIDSGVNITNWIGIHTAIIGGAGLVWIDTTAAAISDEFTMIDVRCEQTPVTTNYCIDIEHNNLLYNLRLQNIRIPSISRGIKLRNARTASLHGILYDGTGVAFDINSTVDDLSLDSIYVSSGSATITIAATKINGCYYQNATKRCYFTDGIVGTTTNDNAAAGNIGEYMSATVLTGASVALATTSASAITFVTLTAGDWDVTGTVSYTPAGTTSVTQLTQGSGTSSATVDCETDPANTYGVTGTFTAWVTAANVLTAADPTWAIPVHRVSIAATRKVCLITRATFTVSTLRGYGFISARRIR